MPVRLVEALLLLLVGAAVVVGMRFRDERRRLRARLAGAAEELQRLQTSFARFAPSRVVEGIALDGTTTEAERRDVTVLFAISARSPRSARPSSRRPWSAS